jgi:hypothetical protein
MMNFTIWLEVAAAAMLLAVVMVRMVKHLRGRAASWRLTAVEIVGIWCCSPHRLLQRRSRRLCASREEPGSISAGFSGDMALSVVLGVAGGGAMTHNSKTADEAHDPAFVAFEW